MKNLTVIISYAILLFTVSIGFTANTGGASNQIAPENAIELKHDSIKAEENIPDFLLQLARFTKRLYLHDTLFEYEKPQPLTLEPTQQLPDKPAVKAR